MDVDELFHTVKTREKAAKAMWKETKVLRKELQTRLFYMPYAEYLKTEHWKWVRAAAIRRAKGRCQLCNREAATFHVHHRTYERRGRERRADVVALCPACHAKHHGKLDK